MPESWLKNAIRKASRIGTRRRASRSARRRACSEEAAMIASASASMLRPRGVGLDELQHLPAPLRGRAFGPAASAGFRGCRSTSACRGSEGNAATPSIQRQAFSPMPGQERSSRGRRRDAEHDVELEHARQPPAIGRRRDLRDVERRRDGGDADAQAADEPRRDEGVDIPWRSRSPRPRRHRARRSRAAWPCARSGPWASRRAASRAPCRTAPRPWRRRASRG